MGLSFRVYCLGTLAVTALTLWHAFQTRPQFYQAAAYLYSAKLNLLVLGNVGVLALLIAGKIHRVMFLGALNADEMHMIFEQARFAVTETCLALTIFREEINMRVIGLFAVLLFTKIFHWLAAHRVDATARRDGIPWTRHMRLFALIYYLAAIDLAAVAAIVYTVHGASTVSALILFAFEFTILLVHALATGAKYVLHLCDTRMEGRWANKPLFMFAVEFVSDLARLLLYLVFFGAVAVFYGLPLHLIREVYVAFATVRERLAKFLLYRRITRNMHERFPAATPEQLAPPADPTCIVCRDDMQTARRLPCGHMFHTHCLRRWLETDLRCPTCRVQLNVLAPPPPRGAVVAPAPPAAAPVAQNAPNAQPSAAPAAPVVAAAAASPQTSAASTAATTATAATPPPIPSASVAAAAHAAAHYVPPQHQFPPPPPPPPPQYPSSFEMPRVPSAAFVFPPALPAAFAHAQTQFLPPAAPANPTSVDAGRTAVPAPPMHQWPSFPPGVALPPPLFSLLPLTLGSPLPIFPDSTSSSSSSTSASTATVSIPPGHWPAAAVYLELVMRQQMAIQQQMQALHDQHAALLAYQHAFMASLSSAPASAPAPVAPTAAAVAAMAAAPAAASEPARAQ